VEFTRVAAPHGRERWPAQRLAEAARAQDLGAQIIDINMGCPAKKVCKAAGSALLRDETLVGAILAAVVQAVPRPRSP
jgi:tRNA-dihydrouridine synthase B